MGLVMASQVLGGGALILIPIFLTRALTMEDFGLYKQFQLLLQTLAVFIALGTPEALIYFVARGRTRLAPVLVSALIQLSVTAVIVGGVVFAAGPLVVGSLAADELVPYVPHLLACAISYAIGDTIFVTQSAQKKFGRYASIYVAFSFLQAALVIVAALAGGTFEWVVWALVAGGVTKMVAALLWAAILYRREPDRLTTEGLRAHVRYAVPLGGTSIVKKLSGQLHRFVVTSAFSPEAFALYGVATTKVPVLGMLRGAVVQVMSPHLAEMEEGARHRQMIAMWHASIARLGYVYVGLTAYLIAFSGDVIPWAFTEKYAAAAPIFSVFCVLMLMESLGGLEALLKAFAQTGFLFRTSVLHLILGLALGWASLPVLGLIGPALAAVVSAAVAQVLRVERVRRLVALRWDQVLPWRTVVRLGLAATGAAAASRIVTSLAPGHGTRVLIGGALFSLGYVVFTWIWGVMPETERQAALRVLARIGFRRHVARPTT